MGVAKLFEDFSDEQDLVQEMFEHSTEELEDIKLKSFEQGYGAGWDDAIKAQQEGMTLLSDTVEASIKDLQMTQEDSLRAFTEATLPLLEGMVSKVLPILADHSFAFAVRSVLEKSLTEATKLPVEIRVAADQQNQVAHALSDKPAAEISLKTDETLAPGQACIGLGASEQQIDLDGLIKEITEAVENFQISVKEGT